MYYPRFTKVIVNFFMTKDQSIPWRNKVNWHYARDDQMFTTIKLVSKHQNTQQYGVILLVELTNEAIKNYKSYKEYYAVASGAEPPKTKVSVRKKQSSSDTILPPPTKRKRLKISAKVDKPAKENQSAKLFTAKGLTVLSEVAITEAEQIKLAIKRSLTQTHTSHASESVMKMKEQMMMIKRIKTMMIKMSKTMMKIKMIKIMMTMSKLILHPKFSTHDEEAKDEESFNPIVRTPSHDDKDDDEDNDEDSDEMNVEGDEGENEEDDANKLYRDVNINLEGRAIQMADVQTTQVIEDTHVNLTLVNPKGQQQSSSVSSRFISNMLNPSPDTGIDSIFDLTP
uniref:Uncharacterized protein n=1 Tax=Tanacetum cinerariifolium TaxID=118510 RepID=A0A699JB02_TANCI|nr:hypothetical protein [Tanacetum cinerariifolium]